MWQRFKALYVFLRHDGVGSMRMATMLVSVKWHLPYESHWGYLYGRIVCSIAPSEGVGMGYHWWFPHNQGFGTAFDRAWRDLVCMVFNEKLHA